MDVSDAETEDKSVFVAVEELKQESVETIWINCVVDLATELDVAKEKEALGEARAVKYEEVVPRTIVLEGASEISEFMR
jgi:hypothetical protein